jgi:acetolactate synthase-1/2/3 large subunit
MVVLTGQVLTHAIGQDAFQECDTVGITRPCVKHNFWSRTADLALTIKKAFYLAATGRPGPVLVDIPYDVTQAKTERPSEDRFAALVQPGHQGAFRTDQEGRRAPARGKAADGLRRGGVVLNNAAPQLTRLVRLLGFPARIR